MFLFLHPVTFGKSKKNDIYRRDYNGYSIEYSCKAKSTIYFEYFLKKGSSIQEKSYPKGNIHDIYLEARCWQLILNGYETKDKKKFDFVAGKLVPLFHLNNAKNALLEYAQMTNTLPMNRIFFNEGWKVTHQITDCFSVKHDLKIIGGPLWNYKNNTNDIFFMTHGILTPDVFWKVIFLSNGNNISFLMRNDDKTNKKTANKWIVSLNLIRELMEKIGKGHYIPDSTGRSLYLDDIKKECE